MCDNSTYANPTKFVRISNIVLLILNLLISVEIVVIKFSRTTFMKISDSIFFPDKALMDSAILEFLFRKGFIFLFMVLIVWIIGKEIRIKSINRRLRINLITFLVLTAYNGLLLYLIYLPVMRSG